MESDGKLGREKHLLWDRKKESATLLAIRSFCNCYGPDADEAAGYPFEFKVHLDDKFQKPCYLQEYRGNRFNIPFKNASAVFFHKDHMLSLFNTFDESQKNKLVKSVMYDLTDNVVLSGIRAMGLLEKQVTTPLMDMLDSSIHVMDTSQYYTRVYDKVKEWMIDPTQLLVGEVVLFEDFPPNKDEQWDALFAPVSAEVEDFTRQCLVIVCHSLCLCMTRQLADHLPNGRFFEADARIRRETQNCPKHNLAPEWLFSALDRKKREMPNATTCTIEGIILWSTNKTLDFLQALEKEKENELISAAMKSRKKVRERYSKRREEIRKAKAQKLREQEERNIAKASKKMADIQIATENVTQYMLCKKADDIELLKQKVREMHAECDDARLQELIMDAIKNQLRYYRHVNFSSKIDYSLFFFTKNKESLSLNQLVENLQKVLHFYADETDPGNENIASSSTARQDRESRMDALKRKLLKNSNESPSKKQKLAPFPGDDIIQKRIRHKYLSKGGKRHCYYKGTVLRKSTNNEKEEYMDPEDECHIGVLDFYTVQYDAPHDNDLYTLPLEKDWNDGCIHLI